MRSMKLMHPLIVMRIAFGPCYEAFPRKRAAWGILLRLEHPSSMLQCGRSGVIPMSDALQLVEQIRSDLRPLETKISGHPYLRALEEGRVQRDLLKVFAGRQHHLQTEERRAGEEE